MRSHIIGEITHNHCGDYNVIIDNDDNVTIVDRDHNRQTVTNDKLIRALLYTLEFYKEQHEFANLQITSLLDTIEQLEAEAAGENW